MSHEPPVHIRSGGAMIRTASWILGLALVGCILSGTAGATSTDDAPHAARAEAAADADARLQEPAEFVERFRTPAFAPRWIVSDGWHSGEWFSTEWRRSQATLTDRGALLTLAASPADAAKPYISGEIASRREFQYGYFEARFRMPHGAGLISAFFTYTRPNGPDSRNEIDMELLGRDPRRLELVYHVADQATLEVIRLRFDPSRGFHTYAFDWQPDHIRWYVDNRLVHISRGGRVGELTRPQRMFASLWNSERMPRWLGPIDPTEAPWRMTIRCMAYAREYQGRSLCAE
jgi:endo-1,3-1,4-beta-glycanase ExoK